MTDTQKRQILLHLSLAREMLPDLPRCAMGELAKARAIIVEAREDTPKEAAPD